MSESKGLALAWQQNVVFRFFASLRLAMLLLGVLIVATVAGTIYESSFDAKVARAYVYGASWFNIWLLLLALNLTASALSRMPWKRHHTGFLITHLGIIILLIGSFIGHIFGVEGSMTLFKGEPPRNLLTMDERVLQIAENETSAQVVPLEFLNRKPTAEHPRQLVTTPSGWSYQAIGYSSSLEVKTEAQPAAKDGVPAVHIILSTAMMGQKLDSWLIDDDVHGTFDLGLASLSLKKGTAPASSLPKTDAVDIEESIFAFANSPADQVAKSLQGGSTGAKVKLIDVAKGNSGKVVVQIGTETQSFEISQSMGKTAKVGSSPYSLTIDQYWPDFRIKDGKPLTLSDQPNNPCILVTLRGHAVPTQPVEDEHATAKNFVDIYRDDSGKLSFTLSSRKGGVSHGSLEAGKPLVTGWADWQLVVDQNIPSAISHFVAHPAPNGKAEGVLVRASHAATSVEQWVPFGWQIAMPTSPTPMEVGYGLKQKPLPISLQLMDFQVERNEGSDSPAGFKSTLEITSQDGTVEHGQCWMNNPISFPSSLFNTFTGLTYKISQASWNPENLSQSSVQILRDPGWGLKWIGSLLIVAGIFNLFYLRPYPNDINPAAQTRERVSSKHETVEV